MAFNLIGAIQMVIGVILVIIPGTQAIGISLIISGALSIAAGYLFKPSAPESSDASRSPTYGFGQWQNRVKGDSALPVIYSNDAAAVKPGHKHAPIYLQAYTTPRGQKDSDVAKVMNARGQGLSVLMAIGEGPIQGISDIRVNEEPLYAEMTDVRVNEQATGSRKVFTLNGHRIDVPSIRISVAGVLKGWTLRNKTELVAVGNGTRTLWSITIDEGLFSDESNLLFRVGSPTATAIVTTSDTGIRPHAWLEGGRGAASKLYVNFQVPLASGVRVYVTYAERYMDGITVTQPDDDTTRFTFATAPASGAAITVDYWRKRFKGLIVEFRKGGDHQLGIAGFDAVRNTIGVGQTLTFTQAGSPVTKDTDEPVDDVIVDLASGAAGFTVYDEKGDRSPVRAQIRCRYAPISAAGVVGTFTILRDPAGARSGKSGSEFECRGDSLSQLYWSFSIRGVLEELVAKNFSNASTQLAAFTRSKYRIEITRTNPVKADTNGLWADELLWLSYQNVLRERLTYPGTALLAIHALASAKLQGAAPNVTCRVQGIQSVVDGENEATDQFAQANPVWAAVDLITNRRYGGGDQFTSANIDWTSADAAADWCDATITNEDRSTEKRSVLDIILDTRQPLMEHVRDLLLPAQVVPVLRGNKWYFIIDQAATLSTAPVVYDDSGDGRTTRDSMSCAHPALTTKISELQVSYLDRDDDFDRNEVWIAPTTPATDRRIERATVWGRSRITEVTRYARFLYLRATTGGAQIGWAMTPGGLRLEAGDVARVVSTRFGIDFYARVLRWELDSSENFAIRIEAAQYMPAVYGQNTTAQTILTRQSAGSASLSGPSKTKANGDREPAQRMSAKARRAA